MSVAKPAPSLRWLAPGLIVTGLMLIGLDLARPNAVAQVKATVVDGMAPVFSVLADPAQAVGNVLDTGYSMIAIYQENQQLKAENDRLRAWYIAAQRLSAENRELQQLVKLDAVWADPVLSARVIADTGGAFARSLLLDRGVNDGVMRGMAAMTAQGVVGRVQTAGERSSRLLLLTDINSRIPAMLEKTGDRLVVAGNNQSKPELQYLRQEVPVAVGDMVLTSGVGGIFPAGLPLGTVTEVVVDGEGRRIRIALQPSVDLARLGYVSLLPSVRLDEPVAVTANDGPINQLANEPVNESAQAADADDGAGDTGRADDGPTNDGANADE